VAALFSTQRREGRWIVPDRLMVTAVGGHVVLDLREAVLQGLHTVVQATLVGGRLHVLVPEGVRVVVTGSRAPGPPGAAGRGRAGGAPGGAARGGAAGAGGGAPGAGGQGTPLIEIRAFTVAGRVRVQTPRRPGLRWPFSRR